MAPVSWIKDFPEAIGTGRHVRQKQRGFFPAGFAPADFKFFEADRVQPGRFQALNKTAWRCFRFQTEQKLFQRNATAFHFDDHALRRIADPAAQFKFSREPEDERAEADALHRAADGYFQPRRGRIFLRRLQRSISKPSRTMSVGFTARTSSEPHWGQTSGR